MKGGPRPGSGRKPGSPNKLTSEHKRTLAEIAGQYTDDAIKTLSDIMKDAKAPPNARAMAANSLLDRAHGKPRQAVEHTGANGGPMRFDLSDLSDEELDHLERIRSRIAVSGGDQGGTGPEGEGD